MLQEPDANIVYDSGVELTIKLDRPKLTPEDIKKLEAARNGPD